MRYADFTKLSPIVKSIGFELKPVGKTAETSERLAFDEYDANVRNFIEGLTPYLDLMILEIIDATLGAVDYDFSALPETSGKKKSSEEEINEKIIKNITSHLNPAVHSLGLKKVSDVNSAAFISKLPELLQMTGHDEESQKAAVFCERLKGKTSILASLLTSRVTALQSWMPNRVIENRNIYNSNISALKTILKSDLGEEITSVHNSIADYVEAGNYAKCLTQDGIDDYNRMINGLVGANGIINKGVIQYVKEYNNNKDHKSLPAPKELHKQILVPREKTFTIPVIKSDEELKELIRTASSISVPAAKKLMTEFGRQEASGLVVRYSALHAMSHAALGKHWEIPNAIESKETEALMVEYESAKTKKQRTSIEKKIENIDSLLKKKQYNVTYLQECIDDARLFDKYKAELNATYTYAIGITEDLLEQLDEMKNICSTQKHIDKLSNYFNAWKSFCDTLRITRRTSVDDGNNAYYNLYEELWRDIVFTDRVKSQAVSYIVRKPGDVATKDLTVLGSDIRPLSRFIDNDGRMSIGLYTILKRAGKFYMFMLTKGTRPINIKGEGPSMAYTQNKSPDATTFLPKMTFTRAEKYFEEEPAADCFVLSDNTTRPMTITKDVFELYKKGLYKKEAVKNGLPETEYKKNLFAVLSVYKEFVNVYDKYSDFSFELKKLEDYKDSSQFFADVNAVNFSCEWISVNDTLIDQLVEDGNALLYLISSRTLYTPKVNKSVYDLLLLKALSDDPGDVLFLSKPKIFTRKKICDAVVTHPKGSFLVNKIDSDGNKIPEKIYREIYAYYNNKLYGTDVSPEAREYIKSGKVNKHKSTTDIIKNKRYTEDKVSVRFSIGRNSSVPSANTSLQNRLVADARTNANTLTVIRSEKDLVYITVMSPEGRLLESMSLNVIDGIDFWTELKNISDMRKQEKSQLWKYTREVKNVRDDFIARAVSLISKLAIQYEALIVIEKIPEDIKNKYDALDNTVYKSFEKALIAKFADLHIKGTEEGKPGSITNPYQLCSENGGEFQDGIVHFVSPAYTGNIDPQNGFVNLFNFTGIKKGSEMRLFLSKMDSIRYIESKNRFEFKFNYENFLTKADLDKKEWVVYAGGPTVQFNREFKHNDYIAETATAVADLLSEKHELSSDFAKLAFNAELTADEASSLYGIFRRAVTGIVNAHDDKRKIYLSPIDGKEYDYAEHSAINLTKKFRWQQIDKKSRREWVNSIAI